MLDVIGGALMLVVGIVVLFLSISRMPKRERPPKIVNASGGDCTYPSALSTLSK
jgi:hypothetical protein